MLVEKIDEMIATAIKSGEKIKLDVYRAIKTAFMNYRTAKAGNVINDVIEIDIISKMAAQRKDSIEQYTAGNRLDLAEKEQAELDILLTMLPKDPTDDDIINIIDDYFVANPDANMKNMKDVMNIVKNKFPTANGGIVSKIFASKIKK